MRFVEPVSAPLLALNTVLEAVPLGVLVAIPEHRLLQYNRRFSQIWKLPPLSPGATCAQILGLVSDQAVDGADFLARFGETRVAPQCVDFVSLKDAEFVECRVYPVSHMGRELGAVWVFKEVELSMPLPDLAVEEGPRRLAAAMGHDFNNLFTVIHGYTDLLMANDRRPSEQKDSLQHIMTATRRGMKLVQQLQSHGALSPPQVVSVNVNDVVVGAVGKFRAALPQFVELSMNLSDVWPRALADKSLLGEVVNILLNNALDAVDPKDGRILVRTSVESMENSTSGRNTEAGEYVCVVVEDNGCGMDSTTKAEAFRPFFTTKRDRERVGLGLSRALGMVNLVGGRIDVDTRVGEGSAFRVCLREAPPQTQSESGGGSEELDGNETIAIVEWDESLRELLRKVLESYGYRVIEAGSCAYAWQIWRQRCAEIDLLLTDVFMPGEMTGCQLAEKIHLESPKCKLLLMSGHPWDVVSRELGLKEECFFLQKPFDSVTLARTVRECLAHSGAMRNGGHDSGSECSARQRRRL